MSKWCLLQLLACVTLHISNTANGLCLPPNEPIIYEYGKEEGFKLTLKPNPEEVDPRLSLRGAPSPGQLLLSSKRQKLSIISKSRPFTLEEIQFKVQGVIATVATIFKLERVKSRTKIRKITKRWAVVKGKFGRRFPDRSVTNINRIDLVFRLKKNAKSVSVKDLVMHACIKADQKTFTEYVKRRGLSKEEFKFVSKKVPEVKAKLTKLLFGINVNPEPSVQFGDMIMGKDQILQIEENIKRNFGKSGREKRKILRYRGNRWKDAIIDYAISEDFSQSERKAITDGMKEWERKTCIQFVPARSSIENRYVNILVGGGCVSSVGFTSFGARGPQALFLSHGCASSISSGVLHELGHLIGFYHEEEGIAANDNIDFVDNNLLNKTRIAELINERATDTISLGVPYNYDSVVQNQPNLYSKDGQRTSMRTRDPAFQNRLSTSRVIATFYDVMSANLAYNCTDKCPKTHNCQRGGYPNPNVCSRCLCPDGFGGAFCEKAATSHPGCVPRSTEPITVTSTKQCLNTPNYGAGGKYKSGETQCSWLLVAPKGQKIKLTFEEEFGISCKDGFDDFTVCLDWVEIRHKGNLSSQGPSFCCKTRKSQIISESNEAHINFMSEKPNGDDLGFKLCYVTVGSSQPPPTNPAPTSDTPAVTRKTTTPPTLSGPTCQEYMDHDRFPGIFGVSCQTQCEDTPCFEVPGCPGSQVCCFIDGIPKTCDFGGPF